MDTDKIMTAGMPGPMPEEALHPREMLEQQVCSDAMLNNLVGPLTVCRWYGDDINVMRFNEQFCAEVKASNFHDLLHGIQRYVIEEDVPLLYGLMERAMQNPSDGAQNIIRVMRGDGTISQFRLHFYFIGETGEGKYFYGSVRDLTHYVTMDDHLRLLARIALITVLFLWRHGREWSFRVALHGLDREMGLTAQQVEQEFNDGRFQMRIDPDVKPKLKKLLVTTGGGMDFFSEPFDATANDGRIVQLQARFCRVHDEASGVEYVLILRKYAKGI